MAIGLLNMDIDKFWNLTPYEFSLIVEGYSERKIERMNELLYHAWHCVALDRQKKLPKLDTIYIKKDKKKKKINKVINNVDNLVEIAKRKGLNGFWNKNEVI